MASTAPRKATIALLAVLLIVLLGEAGPRLLIRSNLSAFAGEQRAFAASALTQTRQFFGGSPEPLLFTALQVRDVTEKTSTEGRPCYAATVQAYTLFGLPWSSVVVSSCGDSFMQRQRWGLALLVIGGPSSWHDTGPQARPSPTTPPPSATPPSTSSPSQPERSDEFSELSAAQAAAGFPLLVPASVPSDLPLEKVWVWTYANGDQRVRALYAAPGDALDANRKSLDVRLDRIAEAVSAATLQRDPKGVVPMDLQEVQVRGHTGYSYWLRSAAAGNWAELTWREGALNVTVSLYGDWPAPSEKNPHALDATLLSVAESLESYEALPATSVVDGWTGTIVALDPMAQYDDYFLRDNGERYGIDGSAGGLTAQIESARQQGTAVQVWGLVLMGVPDVDDRQIVVKRLDMISVLGAAGMATPCAQRPIALPEPARFDPLPDARGAIAVSTAGGGFGLAFPDTGAVVPIHTLAPWCGQQVRQAAVGLAWSPDGRRIAFVYSEYGPPQEEQAGYLMLADLKRGEVRPLLQDAGVYGRPAWSPDGTRLAYVRWDGQGKLSVLDVASGVVSVIVADAVFTPAQAPAWLDGAHIAYTRTAGAKLTQAELVSLALDGSPAQAIVQSGWVYGISPDGRRVAYNAGKEVRLLDMASGVSQALGTTPGGGQLQWSPDGRYLLACPGPAGLLLSRPGPAGPLQQLEAPGGLGGQAWSPDSQRFAFITGDNDASAGKLPALAIYDIESRAAKRLSTVVALPWELVWGPR
ncbi:MAG TPA: hypothetical protein PLG21_15955 [Anaerolineae bacterium]|nr:hypothetical protein [Anaerolineae bacterium]